MSQSKRGMDTAPEIRQADRSDLDSIVPLFDAYRRFFAGTTNLVETRNFVEERLRLRDSVTLLAIAGARGVGFLQLYPLFSSWYVTRIWFLSDLYVDEAYRKAGIGRNLVLAAQRFARESGSRSIMVEIPHSEPHLVEFYQRMAFMRDKTFDLFRYYITAD